MQLQTLAALALIFSSSVAAQVIPDLSTATPIAGEWIYSADTSGSDAQFSNPNGVVQLAIHCTRSTRRIAISKLVAASAPTLNLWTSSQSRTLGAAFDPATRHVVAELDAQDPLLDALSTSRGRIGMSVGADPPLVVPAQAEVARVVEDCRS